MASWGAVLNFLNLDVLIGERPTINHHHHHLHITRLARGVDASGTWNTVLGLRVMPDS